MSRNNIYFYDTHAQRFVDLEEDDANINTTLQKVPKNRYMAKQTLYKRWKKDEHWWYNEPMVVNKKKKNLSVKMNCSTMRDYAQEIP